ncbi:uncharacterized protein LOC109826412 [Asparagus officinalis]|uniref:uncharacterized protein LOC109826412 n=1 Tax=Asparagus officinalis TaxID=4686 RepID=UPI00098E660D|nr:uncharacterized protein LOC109826412 [Asparagus officinalis]
MKAVYFELGLKFTSRNVLKEAILHYSIQRHYVLVYMKNDNKRIHLGCSLCFWEMTAGPDCHEAGVWQIKFINHDHTCSGTFKNRLITDNWIAHVYLDKILRDPKMKPSSILSDIYENFQINVTLKKCRRAKEKALNAVQGLMQRQYGLLKHYMKELIRSNPGTTCVLKMGFTLGYRRIFGLDDCFLKHACGGQLLCAVGRDGNNQMWPIAMGLVPAIHEVWPEVEHRQCARHIYSNWRKTHSGRVLQSQFWKCVKATSMPIFAIEAAKLRRISEQAYEDFMARDPPHILYKPIVSMLEDIRLSIMDRMQEKKKLIGKFVGGVAPRIHKKLKEAYEEQVHCRAHWNGDENETGFEIIHRGQSHAVDLKNITCTCRTWDLKGIPCTHAVSAILLMRRKPKMYLSEMYSQENYLIAYGGMLNPLQGSNY